jgi:hypothetical protein
MKSTSKKNFSQSLPSPSLRDPASSSDLSPSRPLTGKKSSKSVRIISPAEEREREKDKEREREKEREPQTYSRNQEIKSDSIHQLGTSGETERGERNGKDARLLVPKAQDLLSRMNQEDDQSKRLLRGIYSAESSVGQTSLEEKVIEFHLRTKFDSIILQEFARQILASTFDSVVKCDGEFDNTIAIETILSKDLSSQLSYVTQVANNYRRLVIDICARLLDKCSVPIAEDMSFPSLCSPRLNLMMSCFRSYLSLHQVCLNYYFGYNILGTTRERGVCSRARGCQFYREPQATESFC